MAPGLAAVCHWKLKETLHDYLQSNGNPTYPKGTRNNIKLYTEIYFLQNFHIILFPSINALISFKSPLYASFC